MKLSRRHQNWKTLKVLRCLVFEIKIYCIHWNCRFRELESRGRLANDATDAFFSITENSVSFALWPCVWDHCSIKYELLNVLWKIVLCCCNEKKILRNAPNPLISAPWQSWLSFHSSRAAHPRAIVLVVSVSVMHETLALGSLAGEGSALRGYNMCLWRVYTGKHCVVW